MQELHFLRFSVVVLTKLDKTVSPVKNNFLINPNYFYYIIFSSNTDEYLSYRQQIFSFTLYYFLSLSICVHSQYQKS